MIINNFKLKGIYIFISLVLAGCSGGGGGSDDDGYPVPITQPVTTPPKQPSKVPDKNTKEQVLVSDNALVKIGVLDSGVNKDLANIRGKVGALLRYVGEGSNLGSGIFTPKDISNARSITVMDAAGHGSSVSQILASTGIDGTYTGSQNVKLYEAQTTFDTLGHSLINDQLAAIVDLHKKHRVNLFNASWGSYRPYDVNSPINNVLDSLADDNGLIVFSAGNDAYKQPSSESLIPVFNKNVEKALITVVGLDNNKHLYHDPDPHALSKGSNACGQAAAWCIAGNYVTGPVLDYKNNSKANFYGTSGAAPQVTAAAADVWYKYPWMTASQVRQTILTTANYLSDGSSSNKNYNSTYGWGMLNTTAAQNGPSLFNKMFNDFKAQIPDSYYVFSNNISGNAGLIKSGNGTLELSGNNSYTGNTTIHEGKLLVSGKVNGGVLNISQKGTLAGSGTVTTTNNNGTIDLSNGSLTVNGDYNQGGDGIFNAYINNNLDVKGNAQLDGKLNIVNEKYIITGVYDILHAKDIRGTFNQVNGSKFLAINEVKYSADNVKLDIAQVSAKDAGIENDSLSHAGAQVVDSIFTAANSAALKQRNGDMLTLKEEQLLNYSSDLQSANTSESLAQIVESQSGVIYAELPSVLLAEQNQLTKTVSKRLNTMAVLESFTPGVWTSYDYMENRYNPKGWNQVKSKTNNTTIGLDTLVGDADFLIGGFINKNDMSVSLNRNGGSLKSKQNGLGLYSQYNTDSLYLNGLVSYQYGEADIERMVRGNGTQYAQKSNAGMNSASLYIESGYVFSFPKHINITPYAGIEYDRVTTQGINEGNNHGLQVSDMDAQQTSLNLGANFKFNPADGLNFGAFAQLSKTIARQITDITVESNFSDNKNSFEAPGFDRVSFDYGINTNYYLFNSLNLYAGILSGTSNQNALSASGGVKYSW